MIERPTCDCFNQGGRKHSRRLPKLHSEVQDTSCEAWQRLLRVIDEAAEAEAEELILYDHLSPEEMTQVVTLPSDIARLGALKKLCVYGSSLVRIPPEIGYLHALESFDPYTSYRLHWFPYEIRRCRKLRDTRVSTRALYGNSKFRPTFPYLRDPDNETVLASTTPVECSVCSGPIDISVIRRSWISYRIGTDVLPLLVHACSQQCIDQLPNPPHNYVSKPHMGGVRVHQPATEH